MNKKTLKRYFNSATFGPFGAGRQALFAAAVSVAFFSVGSAGFAALGALTTAFTVGQVNNWQKAASGTPFWKPHFPVYGL